MKIISSTVEKGKHGTMKVYEARGENLVSEDKEGLLRETECPGMQERERRKLHLRVCKVHLETKAVWLTPLMGKIRLETT
jgi:hypothetical protein